MTGHGSNLRADLHRTHLKLDTLPAGAVVIDKHGDAWQCGGVGSAGMYWYRAFDGEGISSFQLAQRAESVTVLSGAARDAS